MHEETERDFGMLAPPVALHTPSPPLLAATWIMLRETLLATGQMTRGDKEAIASAVSQANSCPYCVQVHGTALHALLPGPDSAALAGGAADSVADPRLRALARWAATGRGPAPLDPGHLPEAIGTAATFHYLNRMVNIFLGPPPIPADAPAAVRRVATLLMGRTLRQHALRHQEPGRSLDLLPSAPLPPDLHWARRTPTVAGAFARAAAAIDAPATPALTPSIRALLHERLAVWDGTPPGLATTWLDTALAELSPQDRPAGRLVLLTAFASYRVAEPAVLPFLRLGRTPDDLLALTSWAAFTTARHAATRLTDGETGTDAAGTEDATGRAAPSAVAPEPAPAGQCPVHPRTPSEPGPAPDSGTSSGPGTSPAPRTPPDPGTPPAPTHPTRPRHPTPGTDRRAKKALSDAITLSPFRKAFFP
ncbi:MULTISPECIES: carboxymuconolactone decarboxylase family protein [unclassified Streptomyces]|nr:carboxymuconolactone decarboxylase family protein [Streptomyces sp. SA3_actG]